MSGLIAYALARLAPKMAPVQRGTAEELWEQACHFDPRDMVLGGHGEVFGARDGYFLYDIHHMHGSYLYCVPESEVLATFEEVVEKLRVSKENPNIYEHARTGFEKWSSNPDLARDNPEDLLSEIRKAHLVHYRKGDPDIYSMHETEAWLTNLRWTRSKWYWANIVFEWLFFSALILFAAWPFLVDKPWHRWALHLGLLPMLLMLPTYLGYARYTFSSTGPTGGVLYPWIIERFSGGNCNDLDRWILTYTPLILEPLSSPIGMPMALSWRGMPGPTTMVIAGVGIVCVVFTCHQVLVRLNRHVAVVARFVDPATESF